MTLIKFIVLGVSLWIAGLLAVWITLVLISFIKDELEDMEQ